MTPFAPASGPGSDPALLAFVKCHVTSPLKWEALRRLATQPDRWLTAAQVARAIHKGDAEVARVLAELAREGVVVERRDADAPQPEAAFCLPASEPTTVVLERLLAAATHSQELRGIIAAHLLRSYRKGPLPAA